MNIRAKLYRLSNTRGQNIIEYLLVVTVMVIILLYFMNTQSGAPMRNSMEEIFNDTVDGIDGLKDELRFSNAAN